MHRINLEDIHSLSDYQRNTKEHVSRLKETGKPSVLTVNGKAELVVLAAGAFHELAEKIERAEAIEGIHRGLADADAGRVRPVREAVEAIRILRTSLPSLGKRCPCEQNGDGGKGFRTSLNFEYGRMEKGIFQTQL